MNDNERSLTAPQQASDQHASEPDRRGPGRKDQSLNYDLNAQPWYKDGWVPDSLLVDSALARRTTPVAFVILTATERELKAVLRLMQPYPDEKAIWEVADHGVYYLGRYGAHSVAVTMCTTMGETRPGGAHRTTMKAIESWNPFAVIMIGIAAGHDPRRQRIADVLVSEQVAYYGIHAIRRDGSHEQRGPIVPCSEMLLGKFKNALNWSFERPDGVKAKAQHGQLLSGPVLVDNTPFKDELFRLYPTAIGLDMEVSGVMAAAVELKTDWIAAKAICDWGDGRKKDKHQDLAAASAASLVLFVLSKITATDGLRRTKRRRGVAAAFVVVGEQTTDNHTVIANSAEEALNDLDGLAEPDIETVAGNVRPAVTSCKNVVRDGNREMPDRDPRAHNPDGSVVTKEYDLLRSLREPSIRVGELDLKCVMLPTTLWTADRPNHVYFDCPEEYKRPLHMHLLPNEELANPLTTLVRELDQLINRGEVIAPDETSIYDGVRQVLSKGSAPCPRMVRAPMVDATGMHITVAPSRYGISLIRDTQLRLPTAERLRSTYNLTSLGVRVALVHRINGRLYMEFHQRRPGINATYQEAWDVSASGYIDSIRHLDPEDPERISPWYACRTELCEELNVPDHQLPNREHYSFFGVGVNTITGQQEILCLCECVDLDLDALRSLSSTVNAYGRCEATPEIVAEFVRSKTWWIPSALLTIILSLQKIGYSADRIRSAFSLLSHDLYLAPTRPERNHED